MNINIKSAHKKANISSSTKQQGVVLIVALVFLIALTAVAAALMQNTTTDIKMSGATQEKSMVTQDTISEVELVIFNESRQVNGTNQFANRIIPPATINFPMRAPLNPTGTKTSIGSNANPFGLDVECPRSAKGISSGVLKCAVTRVAVTQTYGRDNNQNIQVNTGIAQVVLTTTGN